MQPEIPNGPVPPIFDGRIHGIGDNTANLGAGRCSDFDYLGSNRIKGSNRLSEFVNRCCKFVGWASAMMTFAGMGSFALVGIAVDLLR